MKNKNLPWQARVQRLNRSYYIGNFKTKEEADAAELAFKERRGWVNKAPMRPHIIVRNGKVIERFK